ncbi:MAG: YlxM family DNA-binding protein [Ruminococcus sp.]|nr:YlxM family DNA-binding protein [Ruminococcus sp.]
MDKNIEISLLFDFYGQLLSPKQHEAISLYYNDDYSLSETAEVMGITRQGVRDLVKRSEAELYEYEEKLGLYKRFEQVGESAGKIRALAKEICESQDLQAVELAKEIEALADKLYTEEA